jgi:signal peptidase I
MAKIKNRNPERAPQPSPPASAPAPTPPPAVRHPSPLRWLSSRTVRHANAIGKHVQKLLNHQRDILSPQAVEALETAIREMQAVVASDSDKAALGKQMESLETAANKWLKPYPNAAWRENVEVFLVALAVAMGIRTFFLQPFKIPTGSMQPTLFGVTSLNLAQQPDFKRPTGWARVREWFAGVSYIHKVAEVDGPLTEVNPPFGLPIFHFWQTFVQGGHTYWIWFPPDYGDQPLEYSPRRGPGRAGINLGQIFHKGEDVINIRTAAGDHLFVDRMSYNFRSPDRGEIIVFATQGIDGLPQDQFYIKRMVAMGNEKVQIGDDRHLIINGKRLDAATPHFEKVYSFNPKAPPRESQYSGHVNEKVVSEYYPGFAGSLARLFPDQPAVFTVQPDHYMVMGDNTMNSLDSRTWGDFPASNVIGKSFFVYWPITDRFGWGYHR